MAFVWNTASPIQLRTPVDGIAPFASISYTKGGIDYRIESEIRSIEPIEQFGFDMGFRVLIRYDGYCKIKGNGVEVQEIFDPGYDMVLIVPPEAVWQVRVEVPDPEPEPPTEPETPPENPGEEEPTPTDPEVPVEPEAPSTDDTTPTTGGDGENQASS